MSEVPYSDEPDLGYRFLPRIYPQSAGHPRLEIKISKAPTERHFDPEIVNLLVFSSTTHRHTQGIEHLKVYHPWSYQASYQVAPGMLIISDRKGKKVEAFTFGGGLKIDMDDESTKCIIESGAPIIEIDMIESTVMMLVEEVEIILAKRRAIWGHDEGEFESRLVNIPPSQLYATCIEELTMQFEHDHSGEMTEYHDLYEFILAEKLGLKNEGLWPERLPSISEIL